MTRSGSGIHIQRADIRHAEAVARVLSDAFVEFRPLYTPAAYAATTPDAAGVLERIAEGPVWLALRAGRPLGVVSATLGPNGCYVRGMGVSPTARGAGVGCRLLQTVERFAREHGVQRLFLSTTPFLDAAIRLYERYGFRWIDDGPHDLAGTPLRSMELRLD